MNLFNFTSEKTKCMTEEEKDEFFMKKAINEALIAEERGEVPVGAIIVAKDQIIGRGHNLTETLVDVTAHAEMQAITASSETLGGKYLKGCTLYVTLEPCVMCGGALYWSQIDRVVYGANDDKRGASTTGDLYHPKTKVKGGVLEAECAEMVKRFFKAKRT